MCKQKYYRKWEYLKYRIREVVMKFSCNSASEINLIVAQLSDKLSEIEENLETADTDLLIKTKADLNDLTQGKAKSCIFRSNVTFAELGEKSTSYYLNMEKSRYNAKTCNALFNENGVLVTSQSGILKLQEKFYKDLYSKDTTVSFDAVNNYGIKVSEE